jgi:hypothetical protein
MEFALLYFQKFHSTVDTTGASTLLGSLYVLSLCYPVCYLLSFAMLEITYWCWMELSEYNCVSGRKC